MKTMTLPQRTNRILLAAALDVALTLAALYLATEIRLVLPFGKALNEPAALVNWQVYALVGVIWLVVLTQFNLYK